MRSSDFKIAAYLMYPVIMILAMLSHFSMLNLGCSVQVSAYIVIVTGALLVSYLERKCPNREDWNPNISDIKSDASFMVLVQIILPKILSFTVAITLLQYFAMKDMSFIGYWPRQWPIYLQLLLMLLGSEFFRYWLHRSAHEYCNALWTLHAVHHSPKKLYWMNVGRFHPLEKSLQFLLDALPFIILGVPQEVLAIYFVFYAMNGFFQHCNIQLKLGFLNYIVSGPELHRWHHSVVMKESNKNYGNNLIVWDLIFGTWFLPKGKEVKNLGIE